MFCASGLNFIDNNSTEFLTKGNGVAITKTKFSKYLSVCFWIYPIWSRFQPWIGLLEIRTDLTINNTYPILNLRIQQDSTTLEGIVDFVNFPQFVLNKKFAFIGLMRIWSNLCVSIDFAKNEAQISLNGEISGVLKNPKTEGFLRNRYDSTLGNNDGNEFVLIFGRYYFDKNPFIGKMAGIRIWNRALTEEELVKQSSCSSFADSKPEVADWVLTGTLVQLIDLNISDLICSR